MWQSGEITALLHGWRVCTRPWQSMERIAPWGRLCEACAPNPILHGASTDFFLIWEQDSLLASPWVPQCFFGAMLLRLHAQPTSAAVARAEEWAWQNMQSCGIDTTIVATVGGQQYVVDILLLCCRRTSQDITLSGSSGAALSTAATLLEIRCFAYGSGQPWTALVAG